MYSDVRETNCWVFSWDIILSMVIFYLHTPVLTFLIKHSVCSKIHLLSSSHGFIPLKSNSFCFCFKYLLRFRFTMTTSLNHSEFYIFKMNWLQICKWKLVFIICHSQTNGNIIHSQKRNGTNKLGFKFSQIKLRWLC